MLERPIEQASPAEAETPDGIGSIRELREALAEARLKLQTALERQKELEGNNEALQAEFSTLQERVVTLNKRITEERQRAAQVPGLEEVNRQLKIRVAQMVTIFAGTPPQNGCQKVSPKDFAKFKISCAKRWAGSGRENNLAFSPIFFNKSGLSSREKISLRKR